MKVYRNAARTKQWIRRAFTELMAEKKDINKITVTELAQRADISKTTFYYHYEDIYAVAEEFENELIDRLTDVLSQLKTVTTAEALDFGYYARGIITFLKENEESYRMVLGASTPQLFVEKLKKSIAKQTAESVSYRPFTTEPEKWPVQICFLTSACVDVVVEYFRGGFSVSLDTVTEVILTGVEKLTATRLPPR